MQLETRFHLRLLGALEASSEGPSGARRLGRGKPTALLAYLSRVPGRRASRERLASLLWSDGADEAARQSLRQAIWYLRRRLGEILVTDDDFVELVAGVESDADAFSRAVADGRFSDAFHGYAGDFADGFASPGAQAFEEWAELERRQLRATCVACLESAARSLLSTGRPREAVVLARRALEVSPGDVNAWRLTLESLFASRDAVGALGAAARLEEAMEREEVETDGGLLALIRSARRAGSDAPVTDAAVKAEPPYVTDLVAREVEFRSLVDSWEVARRGHGRALLLCGAAGLGKSRLLADFRARVAGARGRSVLVRAHVGNRAITGGLAAHLAEALAALPGAAAISPASAGILATLSPQLATAYPGATPDRATGGDATRRRAGAIGELVAVLTEVGPLAILVDDGHWADEESLRILGALRARIDDTRVLLVVATRVPDALRTSLGACDEVRLLPFDVAAVADFVNHLGSLSHAEWAHDFIARLHAVSHGIPLLVIETLQRLVESGVLARDVDGWRAPSPAALLAAMPAESALRARLESLSSSESRALLLLSTIGRPVREADLVTDSSGPGWPVVLDGLERRSFVARAGDLVSMWHDEVARAVLDLASDTDRAVAHEWCADFVTRTGQSDADAIVAMLHAARSNNAATLSRAWRASLHAVRARGDARSATRIAAQFLPADLPLSTRRRLLMETPRAERMSGRTRNAVRIGALAVAGLAIWTVAVPRSPDSRVIMVGLTPSGDSGIRLELDRAERWDAATPLHARVVARGRLKGVPAGDLTELAPSPWSDGLLGTVRSRSQNGDEIVDVAAGRLPRALAPAPGDDFDATVAPDGSALVFATRRFDRVFHQSDLVAVDSAGTGLRRLTATSDVDEFHPKWSPDGSRIAFTRRHIETPRADELCVMRASGRGVRCRWPEALADTDPLAWVDARMLIAFARSDRRLVEIDTRLGTSRTLTVIDGIVDSPPESGVLVCLCLDPVSLERRLRIAPVEAPQAWRTVATTTALSATALRWLTLRRPARRRALVETRIDRSAREQWVGVPSRLAAQGVDMEGEAVGLLSLSVRSSDSAVLRATDSGHLEPRRAGTAWVYADAGFGRPDSLLVTVHPSSLRLVVDERWDEGAFQRWRSYGTPPPDRFRVAGAGALLLNGDGVDQSGVYLRNALDPRAGITVELTTRVPLTHTRLQRLVVALFPAVPARDLARWDHVSGHGPFLNGSGCAAAIPAGESGIAAREAWVGNSLSSARAPLAASLIDGRELVLRLSLRPDGRCRLQLGDRSSAATSEKDWGPGPLMLRIEGASVGTSISVARVRVWEGAAGTP